MGQKTFSIATSNCVNHHWRHRSTVTLVWWTLYSAQHSDSWVLGQIQLCLKDYTVTSLLPSFFSVKYEIDVLTMNGMLLCYNLVSLSVKPLLQSLYNL